MYRFIVAMCDCDWVCMHDAPTPVGAKFNVKIQKKLFICQLRFPTNRANVNLISAVEHCAVVHRTLFPRYCELLHTAWNNANPVLYYCTLPRQTATRNQACFIPSCILSTPVVSIAFLISSEIPVGHPDSEAGRLAAAIGFCCVFRVQLPDHCRAVCLSSLASAACCVCVIAAAVAVCGILYFVFLALIACVALSSNGRRPAADRGKEGTGGEG
jgi:hypothetical protein